MTSDQIRRQISLHGLLGRRVRTGLTGLLCFIGWVYCGTILVVPTVPTSAAGVVVVDAFLPIGQRSHHTFS